VAGFTWRYNVSGGRPLILDFFFKDTETLTKGDIVNLESGEIDLAVTTDALLVGAFVGAFDPADEEQSGVVVGTDSVTIGRAIANPDAVYGVADNNARNAGVTLDIAGTTGAQGVAGSSNTEFVVAERKRQTADETRVMITPSAHFLAKH
jgi:hypothetical protein